MKLHRLFPDADTGLFRGLCVGLLCVGAYAVSVTGWWVGSGMPTLDVGAVWVSGGVLVGIVILLGGAGAFLGHLVNTGALLNRDDGEP